MKGRKEKERVKEGEWRENNSYTCREGMGVGETRDGGKGKRTLLKECTWKRDEGDKNKRRNGKGKFCEEVDCTWYRDGQEV